MRKFTSCNQAHACGSLPSLGEVNEAARITSVAELAGTATSEIWFVLG